MTAAARSIWSRFWRDSKGKIVVWQFPNIPLWGWIVCILAAHFFHEGRLKDRFYFVGIVLLVYWAIGEITKGASPFRRTLGVVVLGYTIVALFVEGAFF